MKFLGVSQSSQVRQSLNAQLRGVMKVYTDLDGRLNLDDVKSMFLKALQSSQLLRAKKAKGRILQVELNVQKESSLKEILILTTLLLTQSSQSSMTFPHEVTLHSKTLLVLQTWVMSALNLPFQMISLRRISLIFKKNVQNLPIVLK